MYVIGISGNLKGEMALWILERRMDLGLSDEAEFALKHGHFFGTSEKIDSPNYTFVPDAMEVIWNGSIEKDSSLCVGNVALRRCAKCGMVETSKQVKVVCTDELSESNGYDRDFVYLCHDCMHKEGLSICQSCGCSVHTCDALEIDGYAYCDGECAESHGYRECSYCGEFVHEDSAYRDHEGSEWFCSRSCVANHGWYLCDECDEIAINNNTSFRSVDGENSLTYLCEGCADDMTHTCDACGERVVDSLFSCHDYICDLCHDDDSEYIREYGYTPSLDYFGEYDGSHPYLGIELEIDKSGYKSDRNLMLDSMFSYPGMSDMVWCTEDSSLSDDCGIEVTSHPTTLDCHIESGIWDNLRESASDHGYTSHDAGCCGLHIHINRDFFSKNKRVSDACGYKMLRIFQRFEPAFMVFSRRMTDSWCHFKTSRDYTEKRFKEDSILEKSRRAVSYETNHSQVVNFQHDSTFEIRLFRGTLNINTLYASFALCDGIARFVKTHSETKCERINWYELMAWILADMENKQAHDALESYLLDKELIVAKVDAA